MDDIELRIGRRLRARRRLLQLSQADIGRAVGVSFQQIHKYENGAQGMSAVTLWKLAQALEVGVTYFFETSLDAANDAAPRPFPAEQSLSA